MLMPAAVMAEPKEQPWRLRCLPFAGRLVLHCSLAADAGSSTRRPPALPLHLFVPDLRVVLRLLDVGFVEGLFAVGLGLSLVAVGATDYFGEDCRWKVWSGFVVTTSAMPLVELVVVSAVGF